MAKSIAIVEDDPDQRANYIDAITKKGYNVVGYSSRQEALAGFIGFQEDDIEAFESGEITPSVEICQMLAMALDVDFEDVIPI